VVDEDAADEDVAEARRVRDGLIARDNPETERHGAPLERRAPWAPGSPMPPWREFG
jgi:hypothetical protein